MNLTKENHHESLWGREGKEESWAGGYLVYGVNFRWRIITQVLFKYCSCNERRLQCHRIGEYDLELRKQLPKYPYHGYSHISLHYLSCGYPNCTWSGNKVEPALINCQLSHREQIQWNLWNMNGWNMKWAIVCHYNDYPARIRRSLSAV